MSRVFFKGLSGLPSWKSAFSSLFRPLSAFSALLQVARTLRYPLIHLSTHLSNPNGICGTLINPREMIAKN